MIQRLLFLSLLSLSVFCGNALADKADCIEAPISLAKDVKAAIETKVSGLVGTVTDASFSASIGTVSADVLHLYPNADRLGAMQTMLASVCKVLNKSSAPDSEKLRKYSETEALVVKIFLAPSAKAP
jgi:hypothetical protein